MARQHSKQFPTAPRIALAVHAVDEASRITGALSQISFDSDAQGAAVEVLSHRIADLLEAAHGLLDDEVLPIEDEVLPIEDAEEAINGER